MEETNTKEIQSNMFMLLIKIFAWCTIFGSIGCCMGDIGYKGSITILLALPTLITNLGGFFIIFIISDESKKSLNKLQKISLYYMLSFSLINNFLISIDASVLTSMIFSCLSIFSSLIVLVTMRKNELKLINSPFFFIFSFAFSIAVNGNFFIPENIVLTPKIISNSIGILFQLPTVYFLCTMDYYFKFKTPKVRFYSILFSILYTIIPLSFMLMAWVMMVFEFIINVPIYIGVLKFLIPALAIYIAYNQKDDFIRLIKGNSNHEEE